MKLEGNKFYLVDAGSDNKWVFIQKNEAINQMKKEVKSGNEGIKILEVNTIDEQWEIAQLPWQAIAMELIQDEG